MKKSILFIVGILINFLLANFSNSIDSEQTYVWKGEIVSEFNEFQSSLSLFSFETVDLLEDPDNYVITGCFYVTSHYSLPPTGNQIPVRICNSGWWSCEPRAIDPMDKDGEGACIFYPQ